MQDMKRWIAGAALMALLIGFFIGFQVGTTLAQSQPGISMTSEQDVSGQFQMVITGPEAEVARICSFGDCSRLFPTRLDATNYFLDLFGRANGVQLAPIPPPTN